MFRLKGNLIYELEKNYPDLSFKNKYKADIKNRLFQFLDYVISSNNIHSLSCIERLNSFIVFENGSVSFLTELFFKQYKNDLLEAFNPIWYSIKSNKPSCAKKYLMKLVFESKELKDIESDNTLFFHSFIKQQIFSFFFYPEVDIKYISNDIFTKNEINKNNIFEVKSFDGFRLPMSIISNNILKHSGKFTFPEIKAYKNLNSIPSPDKFDKAKHIFITYLQELKNDFTLNSVNVYLNNPYMIFRSYNNPGANIIFKDNLIKEIKSYQDPHDRFPSSNFRNNNSNNQLYIISDKELDRDNITLELYFQEVNNFKSKIDNLINFLNNFYL